MPPSPAARSIATPRFEARRALVLDTASAMINERGVKGLSLEAVAEQLGIGGTGLTYYFKRRNVLAAACFERSLDVLEAQVKEASAEADTAARISKFVAIAIQAERAKRNSERPPTVARLLDLRAIENPQRAALIERYFLIFRRVRAFFGEGGDEVANLLRLMRTHILLETVHGLSPLLERYAHEEHDRIEHRLVEFLLGGLAPRNGVPAVEPHPIADEGDAALARFLGAATYLINERGYRGASVERIAAALEVTKGSFYHHLEGKDDLVLACFRRSLATVVRAQNDALATECGHLTQLTQALVTLIGMQFGEGTPLLRSTALSALPPELKREVIDGSERLARRFAGMIMDAVSEGSIRAVDPLVAGHLLMSSLNVAFELRDVARKTGEARAIKLYASVLINGLLAED